MFVPRKIAEALATHCDSDSCRYALGGVKLERKDGVPYAVATDGRRLLAVTWEEPDAATVFAPVDGCEVILEPKAFKAASKALKPKKAQEALRPDCKFVAVDEALFRIEQTPEEEIRGVQSSLTVEASDGLGNHVANPVNAVMGRYPNWRDVQPKADGVTIMFDAKYLMEACKSLLAVCPDDAERGITLTINAEDPHESAVTLSRQTEGVAATAIVMPLARDNSGPQGNPEWRIDQAGPFFKASESSLSKEEK
jgi:DNA polymerase III sliding clamp (beta) subunit (PCNA family)